MRVDILSVHMCWTKTEECADGEFEAELSPCYLCYLVVPGGKDDSPIIVALTITASTEMRMKTASSASASSTSTFLGTDTPSFPTWRFLGTMNEHNRSLALGEKLVSRMLFALWLQDRRT